MHRPALNSDSLWCRFAPTAISCGYISLDAQVPFHYDYLLRKRLLINSPHLVLNPEYLLLKDDILAVSHNDTLIRFTDRTMMKVADLGEEKDSRCFFMGRARGADEGITESGGGFFS